MKAADWGLFALTAGWGAWMCWGVFVWMGCSCASSPKPIRQLPAIADLTCTVVAVLAPTSPAVEQAQRVCDAWWAGRAEPREVLDAAERCRPELKQARHR